MKKFLAVVSMAVGLGLAGSAFAQQNPTQTTHRRWDKGWQAFLNGHRNVKRDVGSNPNVILDPNYRRTHPELSAWLQQHPHERSYLFSNGGAAAVPHSWNSFMQSHPNYQQAYYQNPGQFADPNWVNQQQDLQQYYASHPGVRDDMAERARWWHEHHDYNGWRWHHAWNDADEDGDREEHWDHHPPGHAYGWEKHHEHEQWEAREAAEHHHWEKHHGHWHGHDHGHD
jgi:hypothetical protein